MERLEATKFVGCGDVSASVPEICFAGGGDGGSGEGCRLLLEVDTDAELFAVLECEGVDHDFLRKSDCRGDFSLDFR